MTSGSSSSDDYGSDDDFMEADMQKAETSGSMQDFKVGDSHNARMAEYSHRRLDSHRIGAREGDGQAGQRDSDGDRPASEDLPHGARSEQVEQGAGAGEVSFIG